MNVVTNSLWTLVRWAVPVTVAGVLAAGMIGLNQLDDVIRTKVQARLMEEFPGIIVKVKGARLVKGEGIVVQGVSLSDPRLPDAIQQLISIDEIRLECSTNLTKLASGIPQISNVYIRRPIVSAACRDDGTWTTEDLFVNRNPSRIIPMTIEDGELKLKDARINQQFFIREVDLRIDPSDKEAGWALIDGSLSGEFFSRAAIRGRFAPGSQHFDVSGSVTAFSCSERFTALLPKIHSLPQETCDVVAGLRGNIDLNWQARGSLKDLAQTEFECHGEFDSGHFQTSKLPFDVTDMKAAFYADEKGFTVKSLEAHGGSTLLRGSGVVFGWSMSSDFQFLLEAERLMLGRQWESFLPTEAAEHWRKLLPAGEVDVRAELTRSEGIIEPRVSVRCRNLSLTHYRFPQRLDRTVGTVVLEGKSLSLYLTGQAGGQPVQVSGAFQLDSSGSVGHVEVRGEAMRISDSLLAAMPPRSADIVRKLRASGTFDFLFRHERAPHLKDKKSNSLGIRLTDCSMAYAGFPYPLTKVSGSIRMHDDKWTIQDVTGVNDVGVVRCTGSLIRSDDDGQLTLELTGTGVVLERELRDSLPIGMQQIWDDLDPRGNADFTAIIRHRLKNRSTKVEVEAIPHRQTVSIEPAWFPYRLEQLKGRLVLKDGVLRFEGVRGIHDRTSVGAEGTCRFLADGGWHVSFESLVADRFRADHDVVQALPAGLQQAINLVNPSGLLSLAGTLDIYSVPSAGRSSQAGNDVLTSIATPAARWDLNLDMEQGSVDVGVPLEHVHGGVRLCGESDGNVWQSKGELNVDSAMWHGVQMTRITGPIAMSNDGAQFGMSASGLDDRPRRLQAQVAGGTLALDGRASTDDIGSFAVAMSLNGADLERLSGGMLNFRSGADAQRPRGRVSGTLELSGSRNGAHSLTGRGQMRLKEATIYELPVVVALLKVLRVKAPDRNAFGSSLVDFKIEGPHAILETVELSGDAISLVGAGELDIDGEIHLVLRSIMGDSQQQLPAMKRFLGGASGQFLLIHVDGTLASPEITTEAFPSLAAALQRLQSAQRNPDSLRNTSSRREARRDM